MPAPPPQRAIVHLDADAFFAAVEQASDTRLRGKPVAVGGEKRGIIASASYEARRFGVYTPMPTARARKLCPRLIVLPGDFEKYERFSEWMFSYAYDFTPDVEVTSIDEGYFDVSAARQPATEIAATIRQAIGQSLKISVSEGIATNKLISQIASKLHKPAAFEQVLPGGEIPFLHPLPNRWLPGVGPHTGQRLDTAGLTHVSQVAVTPTDLLSLLVGRAAPQLKAFANAQDDRPVVPLHPAAKSYSQQETFAQDQTDEEFIEATLRRMADRLMAKVREDGQSIRTLTVKVRYNDMAEDQCGESLPEPTDLETDLYGRLHLLLRQAWKRRVSLRLVSLRFSNLYAGFFRGELAFTPAEARHDARRHLAGLMDDLRKTHGWGVVMRGHDLLLRDAPSVPQVSNLPTSAVRGTAEGICPQGKGAQDRASGCERANRRLPVGRGRSDAATTDGFGTLGPRAASNSALQTNPKQAGSLRYSRLETCGTVVEPTSFHPAPTHVGVRQTKIIPLPLAVRSVYSFLDSTLTIPALIELAQRHELPALALTDRANLHGAVEFFQAARAVGLKPVLGAEFSTGNRPAWLYVENAVGYRHLCILLSRTDPYLLNPATLATLPTDGLLAVSENAQLAPFFPGRFYLAAASPERLERLADAGRFPAVAVQPARYAIPADRWKYDVVQSIRTCTLLRQEHPEKDLQGAFHLPPPADWRERFRARTDLLERTREIADRCAFEFTLGQPQFPTFPTPDGSPPREFLRRLVLDGLRQRYPDRHARLRPQIEEELGMIQAVGYEEYFLAVWDILQACRREGIEWITRGSAADSLVCYCLGISGVCPIRFDLYFRRFLNRERMAMNKLPDIDIDFPHDRKDDVVDLIFAKYGRTHTAVVGGFSTFKARGAVGEVGKVLGVSERQIRQFTEHFPWAGAKGLAERLRQNPECAHLPVDEEPYRGILQMAEFLDGLPRYPKMHPCGLVLSRQPMTELTPCFTSAKGYPTTHFDMDSVEAIGLVKMDILAQGGLAAMRDVSRMLAGRGVAIDLERFTVARLTGLGSACALAHTVPRPRGTEPPFPSREGGASVFTTHSLVVGEGANHGARGGRAPQVSDPWVDPAVWEMIASGGARAVHHIESPAMISLCRQTNVREIDGLIAIVSVIRPGAANEQKKLRFTRRYQGLEPIVYPHPSLEEALRSTFGLVVYEEHILQICEAFAGLPPGRADVLRRALGKEKTELIDTIGREFVAAARVRGHTDEKIAEVWELVRGFAGYAFCKAHSTAYGIEAYQSAWLKHYFPAEFMAAVLTNGKGFYRPIVYALECHRLGLSFLPPCVNESGPAFVPVCDAADTPWPSRARRIRVPATRIQGLTEATCERLLDERHHARFASLADFYRRVHPTPAEMELLLRAGALDTFGPRRPALFWEIQQLIQRWGTVTGDGQGWLLPAEEKTALPPTALAEPTRLQRLQNELELLGYPVTGHPLELYPNIAWDTYCPVNRIAEFTGQTITLCGLIIEDRVHHQVTGEPMKFLTLADWTGMVETELFAATYKSYALATVRYPVLEITATVEPYENGRGCTLRVLRAGAPRNLVRPKGG